MRQYVHLLQGLDEFLRVIAFVRAQCERRFLCMRLTRIVDHGLGRFAFGVPIGLRDHGVDHQAVAVVSECVAHEAQFAGGLAFAVQPRITVRARFVRLVAAALVAEVGAIAVVTILAVFGYKTFVACPSLDQGTVNAEVLT